MINVDFDRLVDYFAEQPDIRFSVLYGSLARKKANLLSDLDVAVFFQNGLSDQQMGKRQDNITLDLMKIFSINRVDVTILNLADPFLRFQVVKYGCLLHCVDKQEFFLFKSKVFGEYQDIKPMYDFYHKAAIKRLQKGPHG